MLFPPPPPEIKCLSISHNFFLYSYLSAILPNSLSLSLSVTPWFLGGTQSDNINEGSDALLLAKAEENEHEILLGYMAM
jgi:hypothetical protein